MNPHALSVLEFPAVLDLVAGRASSPLGAARVRELRPARDAAWIEAEQRRVAAMRAVIGSDDGWAPEPIPDVARALGRLRAAGSTWSGAELLGGAQLLRSSRLTRDSLLGERRATVAAAVLAPIAERLVVARALENAIERAIDPDGLVRDEASPALRRVRRELRGAQGELVQMLERIMARLESHQRVPDMSVTVRGGRYVIPIRREARGAVGGIVHDESATRGTLFVEPPAAIEFGNRIRELEAEEQREVDRILAALSDELRPQQPRLVESLDALVTLDALYARARFADEFRCAPADLASPGAGFAIRDGRHPLLLARGGAVVPFDLAMAPDERTLLLSGPNTGGKTVLLKALGLISAMMQAGVPAPVGPESRVPMYDDCFADIGDEQSIAASLSTFSAHLRNLGEILAGATAESLVLIDELGSGTDPAEGAALGGAILETLTGRGTFTAATTHLGALKLLASEVPGVVNASLQFDEQALEPTYRLIKGIPGRSYGISIARRLRLPAEVLGRAGARLSGGERDVAALLAELERREVTLTEREAESREAMERATARLERVDERERRLRDQERTLERRARQQARQFLLDARRELEQAIRTVRASAAEEETARDARRRLEELATRQADALDRLEQRSAAGEREPAPAAPIPEAIAPGDVVEVGTLGGRAGQVLEVRDGRAIVAVGGMKLTVPADTLVRTERESVAVETVPLRGDLPDEHAPTEIDLRGMRVEEMERTLMHALDAAVRADLKSMRIIHGKGTGALRERVAEILRGDPRVREHRLGMWNEGGAGVTIAELR